MIGFLVYAAVTNAITNLERAHIASGFGFWHNTAGFDIGQTLIEYSAQGSTYGRAFWVGLLNTLLVAGLGIVFATVIGFIIGIGRLSSNWLVSKVCTGYVETIRNIPLLLQLLFWYNAVLKALPETRDSIKIPGGIFLNNRGLYSSRSRSSAPHFKWVVYAIFFGIRASIAFYIWARKRREQTGQQAPVFSVAVAMIIGLPLVVLALAGFPLSFVFPQGGRWSTSAAVSEVLPEFAALAVRPARSIPRRSTPRWCAPAALPCRTGKLKRPIRWACGAVRPCA